MKTRGASSTTWLLTGLGVIILLIAGDLVRRAIVGPPKQPPAAAAAPTWMPEIGQQAKDFELPDMEGKPHRLSDYAGAKGGGRKILLSFFCGCQECENYANGMERVLKQAKQPPIPVVVMTPGWSPGATPAFVKRSGADWNYLFSETNPEIIETYQGKPCPKVYLLEPSLRISYTSPTSVPESWPLLVTEVAQELGLEYKAAVNEVLKKRRKKAPAMPVAATG